MKKTVVILLILIAGAVAYFYTTAVNRSQPTPTTPYVQPTPATSPPATPNTTTWIITRPPILKSYEINYSQLVTVYIGDVALKISGWSVEGVGEYGNYSFGKLVLNLPPRGPVEITYKAATEGKTLYAVSCASGQCQAETRPANYTSLFNLRGDFRVEKGRCSHMGYAGIAYEERGRIGPEILSQILGGLPANGTAVYTAVVCEVDGVPLTTSANLYLNVTLYGQALTIKLVVDSSASSIGAYNSTRYRQLLAEAKAAQSAGA